MTTAGIAAYISASVWLVDSHAYRRSKSMPLELYWSTNHLVDAPPAPLSTVTHQDQRRRPMSDCVHGPAAYIGAVR